MNVKVLVYVSVTPFVVVALNSLNINRFFKKNMVFQARLLYFFLALALIYLVTNFIYDCASISKIV